MAWGETWTREDVEGVAPDAASWKAGAKLSVATKWPVLGRSDGVVWGHCQGSGKKPYMVSIDMRGELAYKCSCPSRKIPCKHAIGLLALGADGLLPDGDPPEAVSEWLTKRDGRAEKSAARKKAVTSPVPSLSAARAASIRDGCAELQTWCEDQIHVGLATFQSNAMDECDRVASRLVDAGAPGLASAVSELQSAAWKMDWHKPLLDRLSLLHSAAVVLATAQLTDDTPLAGSLRELVGIAETIEGVRLRPPVEDTWHAVAEVIDTDNRTNMTAHTTWLYGQATRHLTSVVEFVRRGAGRTAPVTIGTAFSGPVHPYPSLTPQRVALPADVLWSPARMIPQDALWSNAIRETQRAVAANPWLRRYAVFVSGEAVHVEGRWRFTDIAGDSLPIASDPSLWSLAAVGSGPTVLRWQGGTWSVPGAQQQANCRDRMLAKEPVA